MAKTFVKKAILKPRVYHSPDGTIVSSQERLKHWKNSFDQMTSKSKLAIPVSWDHRLDNTDPIPESEYQKLLKEKNSSKNTVGKLRGIQLLNDGKDGAEVTVELEDETAGNRSKSNVIYLSPVINEGEIKAGDGSVYKDVITHMDLVNHPVDTDQSPFTAADVPADTNYIACGLRLMSTTSVYRMGDTMADEDEKKDDDKETAESETKETETEEAKPEDDGGIKEVVGLLTQINLVLGEDTTKENFIDRLKTAIATAMAQNGEKPEQNSEVEMKNPELVAMSAFAQSLNRERITNRLSELLKNGQCTPAEFEAKNKAVNTVKLSIESDGKPAASDVEKWIEARNAVPAGTFFTNEQKLRMSSYEVVEPRSKSGEISKEQEDETIKLALGR